MNQNKIISVSLSESEVEELDEIAEKYSKGKRSQTIRNLLKFWLKHYDKGFFETAD